MGNKVDTLPPLATLSGFPTLFGVGTYSFICQYYLPGIVTPMKTKRGIHLMIFINVFLILSFYLLLSYTAVFLFSQDELFDLYMINFFKNFDLSDSIGDRTLAILGYYIVLFPVFTLSTNFPIGAITLRENMKTLVRILVKCWIGDKPFPFIVNRILFPILAILPPVIIAVTTTNAIFIISITGAFFGIWLQYLIPVTLVFAGKHIITKRLKIEYKNKYRSPFSHIVFFLFVAIWTLVSILLVVANDLLKIMDHIKFLD